MLRFSLIIYLFSISFSVISQEWTLPFSSRIEKSGKKLQGATVTLMQGSKQVMQTMTGDDGNFKFQIPANGDYTIIVTKTGHCTKKFVVSTRGVPADKTQDNFKGFNIESISLFEPLPGIDYSVLNQPLVKVNYDATKDNFDYDEGYSNQMLSALDRLRELEQAALNKQKELEANYIASIKSADKAFQKKDWVTARAGYNQALTYKPTELYPKDQLAQIEVIIKDQEALNKKAEAEKAAAAKAAADKAAANKAAADKLAADKLAAEKAAADKLAAEKAAAEKLAAEKAAAAKAAADKAAADKLAAEKAAADKLAAEKAAAEKLAAEKAAAAKAAADKAAADKLVSDKAAADKLAADKAAADKLAAEKAEAARLAKEKADKELNDKLSKEEAAKKAAAEKAEADRLAKEKAAAEKLAAEKAAADKLAADKAEAARLAKEKADKELNDKLSKEDAAKKAAADKAEADRLAKEKAAADKLAAEKAAADKLASEKGNIKPPTVDKYKEAKDKADVFFGLKKYIEAKSSYEEALIAKANDTYAKGKLAEIEKLLKSDVATASGIDAAKKALLDKYGPGVTEETIIGNGVVILQRVVVKETEAYLYQKKMFSWGGISYFRDSKAITELIFEQETKP